MGLFLEDYSSVVQVSSYAAKNKNEKKNKVETERLKLDEKFIPWQFVRKKKKKKKGWVSHAGNRTPATAVRAPDPNH